VKVSVVGGGLAGLSAALELADAGHEVTLYEARPTLGGAVQTLPGREGDPEPPPDNKWITEVTFKEAGTYVLRAVASDGAVFTYDNVTVTVTR